MAVLWYRRLIALDAIALKRVPAGAYGLYSHACRKQFGKAARSVHSAVRLVAAQ